MFAQVLLAFGVVLVSYLWTRLRYKRLHQHAQFPQLPTSTILGHLGVLDEYIRRLPPKAHPSKTFAAEL